MGILDAKGSKKKMAQIKDKEIEVEKRKGNRWPKG